MEELRGLDGSRKKKLEKILKRIGEFRDRAREAAKVYGDKLPPSENIGSGRKSSGSGSSTSPSTREPGNAAQVGDQRKRVHNCRVCKQLENDGYGEKIFDNHLTAELMGCPLFIKMNTEERNRMVFKANLCARCLDKNVTVDGKDGYFAHRSDCKGPGKEFTCESDRCTFHIWVCKIHSARNGDKMKNQ